MYSIGRVTRCIAAMLLVFGGGLAAWGQFANAYSGVPTAVKDQDEALSDARQAMLADVMALAMPDMLQAANHGDAAAMRNLGCVYWDGLLQHAADPDRGLQWFERAAVAGNIEALSMIGDHYATGADGKVDFDLAKLWYGKGYATKDARSTVGLAEMSCTESGATQDIAACGKLLDEASSFMKDGDAEDTKPMVAASMFEVGKDYAIGIGTAKDATLAAVWYTKSAALKRPSAAVALSRLYVEPGGLPVDLVQATEVLDGYMKDAGQTPVFSDSDRREFADMYVEIGKAYEAQLPAQMSAAATSYRQSANIGYGGALTDLAMRYAEGTGLPQDLAMARTLLTGWNVCLLEIPPEWERYYAAVNKFNALVKTTGQSAAIPLFLCPLAAVMPTAAGVSAPTPVQPRYPNILAQDTVTPLQKFPVMVSLNTTKIDAGTTIVSATNEQDGLLMIAMPDGMTSILIEVNLVAPQMTVTDGEFSKTIELTVDKDSTTAIFQMQAGSTPGVEPILATLTYNGAFLATIRRDVTVVVPVTSVVPPTPGPPAIPEQRLGDEAPPMAPLQAVQQDRLSVAAPSPVIAPLPVTPDAAKPNWGPVAPKPCATTAPDAAPKLLAAVASPGAGGAPTPLDPEARAPDITIEELNAGSGVVYVVRSPLLTKKVVETKKVGQRTVQQAVAVQDVQQSAEADSDCRQRIVAKLYSDLEAKGAALALIHGKDASQQARDFAEGQGDQLYDLLAPQAFKTVYEKLKAMGAPPKTIAVLTEEPLLPWELMRPMVNGKREDFLGLTVNVVHHTSTSTPRVPPPLSEPLDAISVVMPQYSGTLALPGAQKELEAMKTSFPDLSVVNGTVKDVSNLARALPNGIIHYAGHGVVVTADGLPPDVAIMLNGGSIVPATWLGLAENGDSHPFYFFNACDLGQSFPVLNYVDGWGPALMRSGASGYLGAMWKVSDATAGSFSGHFYADLRTKLLGTAPWSMADVVTQARSETYAERFDPTALAYVLYSAPYQTMAAGDGTGGGGH